MKGWKYIFILLILILSLVAICVFQLPDKNLHIIACNVGQGDATLIIHKNIQVLVDGGPDTKVLDCLGRYLPFYDREIELIILTHPDSDHFSGLIDVFRRYKVNTYLRSPITISKPEYGVLEKEVGGSGAMLINPYNGQVIRVGMIYLDILAPLAQLSITSLQFSEGKKLTDAETNDYSIVSLIRFGDFRGFLAGDMPNEISNELGDDWPSGHVDYIKIPHHGSKNGLTDNLLKAIMPGIAVISVGKNSYGHPSSEVLRMLKDLGVKTLRTDESGDIETVSDGNSFWIN